MSLPISGFTAVPNPMMLSFLATQGFAIMYYGGAGWQFGKRKVSGMSNEEVNKMTPNEFLQQLHAETKLMVPTMQQGMKDMTPLIKTTIEQFGSYIREAIAAFPQAVANVFSQGDDSTLRAQLASLGSTSLIGTGPRTGSDSKFIDQLMAAIVAAKKGGTLPTGFTSKVEEFENTEAKRIEIQKIETARVKRLQELLEAKKAAAIRLEARQGTPQIPILKFGERAATKQAAGQSQRIAKTQFINNIQKWNAEVRVLQEFLKRGGFIAPTVQRIKKNGITRLFNQIRTERQRLTNLLARYQF